MGAYINFETHVLSMLSSYFRGASPFPVGDIDWSVLSPPKDLLAPSFLHIFSTSVHINGVLGSPMLSLYPIMHSFYHCVMHRVDSHTMPSVNPLLLLGFMYNWTPPSLSLSLRVSLSHTFTHTLTRCLPSLSLCSLTQPYTTP